MFNFYLRPSNKITNDIKIISVWIVLSSGVNCHQINECFENQPQQAAVFIQVFLTADMKDVSTGTRGDGEIEARSFICSHRRVPSEDRLFLYSAGNLWVRRTPVPQKINISKPWLTWHIYKKYILVACCWFYFVWKFLPVQRLSVLLSRFKVLYFKSKLNDLYQYFLAFDPKYS